MRHPPGYFKISRTGPDGKMVEVPNLLSEYIEQKISSYVEPQRAGTPRGEKIGFSAKKHTTCLHVALGKIQLKELAKKAKLSYGLLRLWHSEPEFKQKIAKYREDFAFYIAHYIYEQKNKRDTAIHDYIEGKTKDPPEPSLDLRKAWECAHFINGYVISRLSKLNYDLLDRLGKSTPENADHVVQLHGIIFNFISYAQGKDPSDLWDSSDYYLGLVGHIRNFLSSDDFSKDDKERRKTMVALTYIEKRFHLMKLEAEKRVQKARKKEIDSFLEQGSLPQLTDRELKRLSEIRSSGS